MVSILPILFLLAYNALGYVSNQEDNVTFTPFFSPFNISANTVKEWALDTSIFLPTIERNDRAKVVGKARGYLTTPQELSDIAEKARKGIHPYQEAVKDLLYVAKEPGDWSKKYKTISGEQTCNETREPAYLFRGSPLVYAKAIAYHLTGDKAYAAAVRQRVLDLADTFGYGGEVYSGANQCILNLSRYVPGWIMAADLIEDYAGWSQSDKQTFQFWLANEVYKKVDWNSRTRRNNWGSAGSATAAMIADYLWDSPYQLGDLTPAAAFQMHKQIQLNRMNTIWQGDFDDCAIWGIQPYGGIPEELVRGSSGCEAQWIVDEDASWTYTMTTLQAFVLHAELLWRRGDNSIYENRMENGGGSLLQGILFVIKNPVTPDKSLDWRDGNKQMLEVAYRYYRDPAIAEQLRIGQANRYIGGPSEQTLHFGTITHGFADGEQPYPQPIAPLP